MPVRFRSAARWAVLLIALVAVRADAQTTSTRAGLADLMAVPGISQAMAETVYNFFHTGS